MRRIRKNLDHALFLLQCQGSELSIFFVGASRMKSLNTQYRGISKETDVISFPMLDAHDLFPSRTHRTPAPRQPLLLGDIVISVPKAMEQARTYNTAFDAELLRLLIHGLLHLLGYDHEKSRHHKVKMQKKEKEILHAVSQLD